MAKYRATEFQVGDKVFVSSSAIYFGVRVFLQGEGKIEEKHRRQIPNFKADTAKR
jgi:hypothetical protein